MSKKKRKNQGKPKQAPMAPDKSAIALKKIRAEKKEKAALEKALRETEKLERVKETEKQEKPALISKNFPLLPAIALFILIIAIYANTINSPFQWDEKLLIEHNPIIRSMDYFLEPSNAKGFIGYDNFIKRYFSYVTFAINYWAHGTSVQGYHVLNILIHLFTSLSVYWLVSLLMQTPALKETGLKDKAGALAFLSAAVFAVHPVQTEAVTYIFQRHALLVGLLYVLAVALYLNWRRTGKWLWYGLCLLACVLAMKSKGNAFTLPVMITLTEFMFFGGFKVGKLNKRVLFLVPVLLTMLIIPLTQASVHSSQGEEVSVIEAIVSVTADKGDEGSYLLTQLRVMATYLRLLALPVGQNLDYDFPEYSSLSEGPVLASLLLLLAVAALGAYCFRVGMRGRREFLLVAWGLLWFFIAISVESSFIKLSMVINEYRMYLPIAGLVPGAIGLLFIKMEDFNEIRGIRPEKLIVFVVIVLFAMASIHRNAQWESKITLWGDVVKKSPMKTRGMLHLGVALEENKQFDEALKVFKRALEIEPDNHETHYDMGVVYGKQKDNLQALRAYMRATELNPAKASAHNNLGALYVNMKQYDKALESFKIASDLEPINPKPHNNMSIIYLKRKEYDFALEELLLLLKYGPRNPFVHNKLGYVYFQLERYDKAEEHYKKSISIDPQNKFSNFNMGRLMLKKGNLSEAEAYVSDALQVAPENKDFRSTLKYIQNLIKQKQQTGVDPL
jgi:Flp pilus assembly protein TadD/4-amino-4-deoxy-L-arabinose transferase-like glycosyltransferase